MRVHFCIFNFSRFLHVYLIYLFVASHLLIFLYTILLLLWFYEILMTHATKLIVVGISIMQCFIFHSVKCIKLAIYNSFNNILFTAPFVFKFIELLESGKLYQYGDWLVEWCASLECLTYWTCEFVFSASLKEYPGMKSKKFCNFTSLTLSNLWTSFCWIRPEI